MIRHRAVIDCAGQRMYLCGPGEIQFQPPPGTQTLRLERAPSGHIVLPISEYEGYKRWVAQCPANRADHPQLALAMQPSSGSPGPRSRPPASSASSSSSSAGPLPTSSTPTSSSSCRLRSPAATDQSVAPSIAVAAAAPAAATAAVAVAGSRESSADHAARAGHGEEVAAGPLGPPSASDP